MKKITSLLLSILMLFSLTISAAASPQLASLAETSEVFGIPIDILEDLDQDMLMSLREDAAKSGKISYTDTYVRVVEEADGTHMVPSTYAEYLRATQTRVSKTDESSGWMKFHTTLIEVDATTGQASGAFTWLTPPSPRMMDVVGLALANGVFDMNSANGFYRYSCPGRIEETQFIQSDIKEEGHSVSCKFQLERSDYLSDAQDFIFLRATFAKEGNSAGVNSTYGHQKLAINLNLEFSIGRNGVISCSVLPSLSTYYDQAKGYASIRW